jgi:hypothetical protein
MVRRTASYLVLVVCGETATALSVVFICAYFSFEFQFALRIAFRRATTNLAYFELIAIATTHYLPAVDLPSLRSR